MTAEALLRSEGFPGQRLRVLPRPVVGRALRSGVTSRLLVTDAGFFPRASRHGRVRPRGAEELIIIVCAEGRGEISVGGRALELGRGEAVAIRPHAPHSYRADAAEPWSIWWLHVQGAEADGFCNDICDAGRAYARIALRDPLSATDAIRDVIARMEADATTAGLYEAAGAAWRLLAVLAADRLRGPAETGDRIQLIVEHLRRHPEQPVRVGELARAANLSVSHFSALFSAATGSSVVDFARGIRIARARELLRTTDHPVAAIATQVGYPDPFYFARQFKRVTGVSPTEFRRTA
ncbi:helix-turn-helix domain-containing protein [Microbacterium sp. B2969]|uniref:Helix-turn-helix domain-containing protein n=1 Tax=Microbacterium alkaliflavum TaxID=3248839 RepID=A0ABW7QDL1_9MICO